MKLSLLQFPLLCFCYISKTVSSTDKKVLHLRLTVITGNWMERGLIHTKGLCTFPIPIILLLAPRLVIHYVISRLLEAPVTWILSRVLKGVHCSATYPMRWYLGGAETQAGGGSLLSVFPHCSWTSVAEMNVLPFFPLNEGTLLGTEAGVCVIGA